MQRKIIDDMMKAHKWECDEQQYERIMSLSDKKTVSAADIATAMWVAIGYEEKIADVTSELYEKEKEFAKQSYEEHLEYLNYNRANRFKSIKDYFSEADGDFDSSDMVFDLTVTCVEPYDFAAGHSDDEFYDKFCNYIYENVNVIGEESGNYSAVCDWSGFFYKHYDTFKEFANKYWDRHNDLTKLDYYEPYVDEDLCYQWIKEISGFLSGYATERSYKDLYEMLIADDKKPPCERYELYYAKEIAPYLNEHNIKAKSEEYASYSYDYASLNFQSNLLGKGTHTYLCVNTEEKYAFFKSDDDEATQKVCELFGKRECPDELAYNNLLYNVICSSLGGNSDFSRYEMTLENTPFSETETILYEEGKKTINSESIKGLTLYIYNDGSGYAEFKGEKISSVVPVSNGLDKQFIDSNSYETYPVDSALSVSQNYMKYCEEWVKKNNNNVTDELGSDLRERDFGKLTYDYISPDFQSEFVGCGYPINICVNTDECYAFLLPNSYMSSGFESAYETAYWECVEYGKRDCWSVEDFNKIAASLADKRDYRNNLELGENDLDFSITPLPGNGRK